MSSGSGRSYPLVLGVLAAASAIAIWALQGTWVMAEVRDANLPVQKLEVAGSTIYPASVACAWVALACVAAIIALRGRWRIAAGALVLICSAGILIPAIAFPLTSKAEFVAGAYTTSPAITATVSSLWIFAGVAGVLAAACGITTLVEGTRWRSLSARQSHGTTQARGSTWDALDRGEDPTVATDQ